MTRLYGIELSRREIVVAVSALTIYAEAYGEVHDPNDEEAVVAFNLADYLLAETGVVAERDEEVVS